MTIQVDFWQLVGIALTVLGGFAAIIAGAGRLTATLFERRLDERFASLDSARDAGTRHWDERFSALLEQMRRDAEGLTALERQFLSFKADLPLQYVRREDYVRGQAVLEAKQDALYNKIDTLQMQLTQGGRHG